MQHPKDGWSSPKAMGKGCSWGRTIQCLHPGVDDAETGVRLIPSSSQGRETTMGIHIPCPHGCVSSPPQSCTQPKQPPEGTLQQALPRLLRPRCTKPGWHRQIPSGVVKAAGDGSNPSNFIKEEIKIGRAQHCRKHPGGIRVMLALGSDN